MSAALDAGRDTAPPPGGLRRTLRGIAGLLVALLLLLGFIASSSLVAAAGAGAGLRLAVGVTASLILPWLLGAWSRARLRPRGEGRRPWRQGDERSESGRGREPWRGRGLSTATAVALCNLMLLGGLGLVAPRPTRAAIDRHGAWWLAAMSRALGRDPANRVVEGTQALLSWLARKLPDGSRPASTVPPTASDASRRRADAGLPPPGRDSAALDRRRPDGSAGPAGAVRVAFHRRQGAVLVPVRLQGPAGEAAATMIFDTGASLTTLDEATLRRLGLMVAPGEVTVEVRTANGLVRRPLAVIEALSVGGARLGGGLTVAVCEPCAQGEAVGLLGLNVSSQFRVTLDQDAGELVLEPLPARGHLVDISPWVELRDARGLWRGPLLTVDATVENRAPRELRNVRVAAVVRGGAREGQILGELASVPARGSAPLRLQGLPPIQGSKFQLRLEQAEW